MEKYGFVYIWYDRKHKRYYVGCRWGNINDGYICSSPWMKQAYLYRPKDFRRRILKTNIHTRQETYVEEQRWLNMIKPHEVKIRYYNLCISNNEVWHKYDENIKTIGQKISAAKKGKSTGPCSPEKARRISEAKKAAFASGATIVSEEWRRKNGEARKGKSQTEESNRKRSEALKQRWATHQHHNIGRVLSDEHKQNIGKNWRGRLNPK